MVQIISGSINSPLLTDFACSERDHYRGVIDMIFSLVLRNKAEPLKKYLCRLDVVDLNIKLEGWTPLHVAASKGNSAMVDILLDHGARINSVTTGSFLTALHIAAVWGHKDVVDLILERGAKRSIKASDGRTASQLAKGNGQKAIARQIKQYSTGSS